MSEPAAEKRVLPRATGTRRTGSRVQQVAGRLHGRWQLVLLVLFVAAMGNLTDQPRWTELQLAASADSFRQLTADSTRTVISAAFDIVIAASYGALGLIAIDKAQSQRKRGLATVAAVGIVIGAAFDEIENGIVLLNLARRDSLTDALIDAMRAAGAFKLAAFVGAFVWIVLLIGERLRRPPMTGGWSDD